jgi:hypothetical protein
MKRFLIIGLLLSSSSIARAQEVPAPYQQVLTTLGKKGDYKDNVFKVNIPRNDLTVKSFSNFACGERANDASGTFHFYG